MVFTSPRDDDVEDVGDDFFVRRAQAGDATAFAVLYRRHGDRLFRYCLRLLGDVAEAEDAAQEAFARAWKALPDFGGDRRFYPWLAVIAHNLCVDLQRRSNHVTLMDDSVLSSLLPAVSGEEELVVDRTTEHDILLRALGDLSDRHREVLELREGRNWTYQQIASHSGVEVSTVETLLFRARRSLKEKFLQLARAEGALGVLFGPLAALRQWLRRTRSSVTTARTALSAAATPSGALGGAAAAVATSAIVATSFAVGGSSNAAGATPTGDTSHATAAVHATLTGASTRRAGAPALGTNRRNVPSFDRSQPRHRSGGSSDPSLHTALPDSSRMHASGTSHSSTGSPPSPSKRRRTVSVDKVVGGVGDTAEKVVDGVTHSVKTLVGGVTGRVGSVVNNVTGTVGSVVNNVTGTVGSVVNNVTGTVGSVVNNVTGTVGSVVGSATGTAATVVGGVVQATSSVLPALPVAVPSLSSGVSSEVASAPATANVSTPAVSTPAVSVPIVSVPAVSVPAVSVPAVTVPPLTLP